MPPCAEVLKGNSIMTCDNCAKHMHSEAYMVWENDTHKEFHICSVSCLLDWGWHRKESQDKLDKTSDPCYGIDIHGDLDA